MGPGLSRRRRLFPSARTRLISKAYTQLARIWYRRGDCERARQRWKPSSRNGKSAKKRDQDLVDCRFAIAIKLEERTISTAVVQGMKNLTRDDVPDMYDPALVEMSLEICADAIERGQPCGIEAMRGNAPGVPRCSWCDDSIRSRCPKRAGCRARL